MDTAAHLILTQFWALQFLKSLSLPFSPFKIVLKTSRITSSRIKKKVHDYSNEPGPFFISDANLFLQAYKEILLKAEGRVGTLVEVLEIMQMHQQ